ncbi:MAG: tyrosine--tRNA ligase [Cellulosilyticaceae bacterium]
MKKSIEEQVKIITKGVHSVIHEDELIAKLKKSETTGKPLTIKLGLDPSAPDIHLGHAVVLRKIKQMQDLGHQAVIIIGDFTGKIGDPTGKAKGRVQLSDQQVVENAKTYEKQIFKVLDREKTQVRFNSEWLSQLGFEQVIRLAATTTVARMLERDDFQKRYNGNSPIGLHEFFYPLMQAYDSVELQADIELGGTDQTFNILMGRTLQKAMGQEAQIAMFMPILEGLDGKEKMSKSLGNYIGVNEPAEVMFKKVMEVPDALIIKYFELATDEHPDQIEVVKNQLEAGVNPRDIKLNLARIITALYHKEEQVLGAEQFYMTAFSKKVIPDDVPELQIDDEQIEFKLLMKQLVEAGLSGSSSELRRLVDQGGVQKNSEPLEGLEVCIQKGDILRIGKKKFIKIVTK